MKDRILSYFKTKLVDDQAVTPVLDLDAIHDCMLQITQNIYKFDEYGISISDTISQTEVLFTFLSFNETAKLVDILTSYNLLIKHVDITEAVLMGTACSNKDFAELFYSELFYRTDNKKMLNHFIQANLTTDIVLEKITKYGMNSLTAQDLSILKKTI